MGYIQSTVPREGFERVDTLQIDLTQSADALYAAARRTTRNEINRAHKKDAFAFAANAAPTAADLHAFLEFYNAFARTKGTTRCGAYHVHTLKLLAESNGLTLTRMADDAGALCYHAYAVDARRATLLYSGSQFRSARESEVRNRLARANRYLHWRDMLHFQERGVETYDWGGLTRDANIADFKRSFGGVERAEYSGYVPLTMKGHAATAGRLFLSTLRNRVFNAHRSDSARDVQSDASVT